VLRTLERCAQGRVASQDVVFVLGRCLAHPAAQDVAWDFIRARWSELSRVMPPYHAPRLVAATAALRHPQRAREVVAFFRELALPATGRALRQVRERFAAHAQLRRHAGPGLEAWSRPASYGQPAS